MKFKKLILIIMLGCTFFITGCNNLDAPKDHKTLYQMNEQAIIDNYEVTLTKAYTKNTYNSTMPKNDIYLFLTYQITNKGERQDINIKEQFKFSNNNIIATLIDPISSLVLDKNEIKEITIIYDISKESSYTILFYSGVVSNNIGFEIQLFDN